MKRYIFAAAVAAMGIGMVLVYSGVIGSGLIIPGAALISIGILLAALGGVAGILMNDTHSERLVTDPLNDASGRDHVVNG